MLITADNRPVHGRIKEAAWEIQVSYQLFGNYGISLCRNTTAYRLDVLKLKVNEAIFSRAHLIMADLKKCLPDAEYNPGVFNRLLILYTDTPLLSQYIGLLSIQY